MNYSEIYVANVIHDVTNLNLIANIYVSGGTSTNLKHDIIWKFRSYKL